MTDPSRTRIAHIVTSPAARALAERIEASLQAGTILEGSAAELLPAAWRDYELIVCHLALGATTRIIAPLLTDKHTDPGVVVVDEAGRFAVPLVGGHGGGANELARRIAEVIGATPVLTTATDALGVQALDLLGWPCHGDLATVTRAMLDARPVQLVREVRCPLPALPGNVGEQVSEPVARIVITDRLTTRTDELPQVVLTPPTLVAGMGCNRGTSVAELHELLTGCLAEAGLAPASLARLVSVDVKADEPGLVELAEQLGVPLGTVPADELRGIEVPHPSATVAGHVGTPSVAEAAVLAQSAELLVDKRTSANATCAIGRLPVRGRLAVVGLGPGARDLLTPRAVAAIRSSSVLAGYRPYVEQVIDLALPGTRIAESGMGDEHQRTAQAIELARQGEAVALVCSGDPAIYAMASPVLEQGTEGIDVQIVPGVTASLAASAILGAPLGHDHATISLSDLHTDWAVIELRLRAAATGDLVTVLYNPRSRTRTQHLVRALELLGEHRPPSCPVAVVEEAERPGQRVRLATLETFQVEWVNMNSLVVVGSSTTRFATTGAGEQVIVTPRDYHWMEQHA